VGGPAGEFGSGLIYQGLEKALEMGTFLHWGPVKNHGRSIHQELLRDSWRALEMQHSSLWALCEGNLRGAPLLGTLKVM